MDYFDNYLNRLNQDGNTFQERVISRREKKFERFINKSIYKTTILKENGETFIGSMQPTKDSEKTCLYTLLTSKETHISSGELLTSQNTVWLTIHKLLDQTLGHNVYTVMLLPQTISITDEDTEYTIPARITNDSTSMIDDFFSTMSGTTRQYREPDREIKVICKKYDFLKKDMKFMLEGDTYKIEGINKTAVPNCIYLTTGQCLTDASLYDGDADDTDNSFWGDI